MTDVKLSAAVSSCGKFRYSLGRHWGSEPDLLFVMLNPSTADARVDDPTIRRCVGFAKREGAGGIQVVNLFAFRATKPEDMRAAVDPVGPENNDFLVDLFGRHDRAVAAWGSGPYHYRAGFVRRLAAVMDCGLLCLGKTKDGSPRHPLYVRADQPLVTLHG